MKRTQRPWICVRHGSADLDLIWISFCLRLGAMGFGRKYFVGTGFDQVV